MNVFEYLEARASIFRKISELEDQLPSREDLTFPSIEDLRPATEADVVVGSVFFYSEDGRIRWWSQIDEIRWPDDDYKAFVGTDGCRHGLKDAWVTREKAKEATQ